MNRRNFIANGIVAATALAMPAVIAYDDRVDARRLTEYIERLLAEGLDYQDFDARAQWRAARDRIVAQWSHDPNVEVIIREEDHTEEEIANMVFHGDAYVKIKRAPEYIYLNIVVGKGEFIFAS